MNSAEKFCLRWNDFQQNITTVFGALKDDTEFADVTLACEDGQQVEAHKVILAASSPFFQNLLRRNKHPHPLIYMRGVAAEDLKSVIDYIYYGEANVQKERMEFFMQIAQELQIKGLSLGENEAKVVQKNVASMQHFMETNDENIEPNMFYPKDTSITEEVSDTDDEIEKHAAILEKHWSSTAGEKTQLKPREDLQKNEAGSDMDFEQVPLNEQIGLNEQIKLMIGPGLSMGVKQRNSMCKVCGKESSWSNIKDHIESKHIEGISIPCGLCDKAFKTRKVLKHHHRQAHSSVAAAPQRNASPTEVEIL